MSATVPVEVTVNGERREAEVEPRLLLVHWLRDELGLTGTHVGCDTTNCGACTVHLDGEAVKSCTVLAVQADGAEVTTIEGLAVGGGLHPLQARFWEKHGLQCGFCTPGMIMAAADLLAAQPEPHRRGDPARPRGQPLPLHGLPQHRRGGEGRGRAASRRCRHERHRPGHEAQGGPPDDHRAGRATPRTSACPACCTPSIVRSPEAHATITSIDTSAAKERAGVVAVLTGEDMAGDFAGGARDGLGAAGRGDQDARALAAQARPGQARGRPGGRGRGRVATARPSTPPRT